MNNFDEKTIQQERLKEQETLEDVLFNGDTERIYRDFRTS